MSDCNVVSIGEKEAVDEKCSAREEAVDEDSIRDASSKTNEAAPEETRHRSQGSVEVEGKVNARRKGSRLIRSNSSPALGEAIRKPSRESRLGRLSDVSFVLFSSTNPTPAAENNRDEPREEPTKAAAKRSDDAQERKSSSVEDPHITKDPAPPKTSLTSHATSQQRRDGKVKIEQSLPLSRDNCESQRPSQPVSKTRTKEKPQQSRAEEKQDLLASFKTYNDQREVSEQSFQLDSA